jgi:energy-converting hydrogenase B subunit D
VSTTTLLRDGVLLVAVATGTGVVLTRDPVPQTLVLSLHGLVLALVFFLYSAPDVALSQIVVGAIVLPLMFLLALAKVRRQRALRDQERP